MGNLVTHGCSAAQGVAQGVLIDIVAARTKGCNYYCNKGCNYGCI
jgi:hypothetical protein